MNPEFSGKWVKKLSLVCVYISERPTLIDDQRKLCYEITCINFLASGKKDYNFLKINTFLYQNKLSNNNESEIG